MGSGAEKRLESTTCPDCGRGQCELIEINIWNRNGEQRTAELEFVCPAEHHFILVYRCQARKIPIEENKKG